MLHHVRQGRYLKFDIQSWKFKILTHNNKDYQISRAGWIKPVPGKSPASPGYQILMCYV